MEEDDSYVPSDLTAEERQELENIRRRKQELLADIQRLKDEIAEVANEIENLGSTEERKNMQRNKQVAMGRKKFNMDPKKGIQFLIENDLLKNTCEDIAQFLYKGEGLNKTAIGDYLGERDEFNIQVLHAFVGLHEFTDLNLVQALRQFLWSFRLPGEAQKIDRMMEAFAQRYCQCNPGVFQSTDTCYVLSFAIIMLNTSLHNPNVKDKPTVERFIAMNRGINDGGDLPEELLRNLYESIKNEPFKIPEDDGNDLTHTFFNPDREGWLLKLGPEAHAHVNRQTAVGKESVFLTQHRAAGGRVKTWKRRWFILTDNCLYYFEYTTDKEPRGIIPLENLSIREVEDSKKPNCFELYIPDNKDQVIKACKTEADGRVVEGNHTVYRISAPTPEEKEEWIKCISHQQGSFLRDAGCTEEEGVFHKETLSLCRGPLPGAQAGVLGVAGLLDTGFSFAEFYVGESRPSLGQQGLALYSRVGLLSGSTELLAQSSPASLCSAPWPSSATCAA
ncbi:cytohesin-1 isoform X2 [Saccopteryx bilineata]|uniref:cytohesin-1 isoform X2 n=1 Tax=Saccopteryx bilineata TaxID=59482 RepID=UPI00338EAEF7